MLRKQMTLFFLLLCVVSFAEAQQDTSFLIKGRVIIAETKQPLALVNVFNISNQQGTTTNQLGEFELTTKIWPVLLQFTYVGYESLAVWVDGPEDKWLDIQLHPYFATLPDVVVSAQPIIETITKPSYTVRDYIFNGNQILIATLPGIKSGNNLVLIDEEGIVLDSISIKDTKHFDRIHRSCLGNIHLVTRMKDYELTINDNQIEFVGLGSRTEFNRLIEPCVSETDSLLVYCFRYCIGQLLEFKAYEKDGSNNFLLAEVSNDENMGRRFEEEFAHLIGYIDHMNLSWEEKKIELKRAMTNNMSMEKVGHVNLFYQPINVPIFSVANQLLLFNHLKNQIQFFDQKGSPLSSIPITFPKEKKWDGLFILDEYRQDVYTLFDHPKGKMIRKLNLDDGTLDRPILIDCVMVSNIKVNDGHLYYLESGTRLQGYNKVLRKVKLD